MAQMHDNSIDLTTLHWFERDPKGAMLMRQAQTLLRLQTQLQAYCGLPLEVCTLRDRFLVLMASGAMAARLRQQTPSMLRFLRAQGWSVDEIKIKARPYAVTPSMLRPERKGLPRVATESLADLGKSISHPKLQESLERVLRQAKR